MSINSNLPKHIAIIMDGNGRWAKKRFLPRFMGHKKATKVIRKIVQLCAEKKIEALTLFAFSTENWKRPADEVSQLMNLFLVSLEIEVKKLHANNIRLQILGDVTGFSEQIREAIIKAEALTSQNTGLRLNVAANYGGRWDILQAIRHWQAANPNKSVEELTEQDITNYLVTSDMPEADLLIRTGGEKRVSNFMLWQMAYAEYYFCDTFWPDFDEQAFNLALASFTERERRFGKTSEQIKKI